MTTSKGRRFAFAIYVNNVPVRDIDAIFQVDKDLGSICEAIYIEN
jgi:D-alanyl-D-alanine carboxypeptidase/D-alanyl-D-alanine-endopeptidase (penicillin-binding protein 4)